MKLSNFKRGIPEFCLEIYLNLSPGILRLAYQNLLTRSMKFFELKIEPQRLVTATGNQLPLNGTFLYNTPQYTYDRKCALQSQDEYCGHRPRAVRSTWTFKKEFRKYQ
ncbi:hypothetical protein R3P38DRAFT_2772138 [Favolaschia claudopus]|uniref:Uncharacterized protein n=1 Tax=Favolaschia claudopus TaxID=2862362 RepID=A0AAW0A836_9AGAR